MRCSIIFDSNFRNIEANVAARLQDTFIEPTQVAAADIKNGADSLRSDHTVNDGVLISGSIAARSLPAAELWKRSITDIPERPIVCRHTVSLVADPRFVKVVRI